MEGAAAYKQYTEDCKKGGREYSLSHEDENRSEALSAAASAVEQAKSRLGAAEDAEKEAEASLEDASSRPSDKHVLFGLDPGHEDQKWTSQVVSMLHRVLSWVEEDLEAEGIWRKAGQKTLANKLQQAAEERHDFPSVEDVQGNRHTMITVLQRWMRSIEGGLIDPITAANAQKAHEAGASAPELINGMQSTLSYTGRELVCRLLVHWHRVTSWQHANRMDAYATACCVFLMAQSQEEPNMGLLQVIEVILKQGTVKVALLAIGHHVIQ